MMHKKLIVREDKNDFPIRFLPLPLSLMSDQRITVGFLCHCIKQPLRIEKSSKIKLGCQNNWGPPKPGARGKCLP